MENSESYETNNDEKHKHIMLRILSLTDGYDFCKNRM